MTLEQVVTADKLDNLLATILTQDTATRAAVVASAAAGPLPSDVGLGNIVVVTPNGDGSWTGRFPSPRQSGTQYWWASLATSPAPTGGDGWVVGDYVAPAPYALRTGGAVAAPDVWGINTAVGDDGGVTFTLASATTSAPAGALYSWTFGDGFSSFEANPKHWYSSAGTYTVRGSLATATGVPIAQVTAQVAVIGIPATDPHTFAALFSYLVF